MSRPANALSFILWNVQDFAHFDISRVRADRWPTAPEEYAEKFLRVERVLQSLSRQNCPQLLALAEVTEQAAHDLRDSLFPRFRVFSIASLYTKPDFHLAVLYDPSAGLWEEDFFVVTSVPETTRPWILLDYQYANHKIRFYVCHWTARFQELSEQTRETSALQLRSEIYRFLNPKETAQENRHVVILGDLNEEPYGLLEKWLYAYRHRAASRRPTHYTDKYIERVRLYNCAWRLLGEHNAHPSPLGEREMAGSYYWRAGNSWHTYDQVIVNGSLVSDSPPYIDERSLRIASWAEVLPDDLLQNYLPHKFDWNNGHPKGVSDHLPVCGRIILS